jgi:hypothetical protein
MPPPMLSTPDPKVFRAARYVTRCAMQACTRARMHATRACVAHPQRLAKRTKLRRPGAGRGDPPPPRVVGGPRVLSLAGPTD